MMDIIESENNSICEEPEIYYYSPSSNIGVGSIFSERLNKPYKDIHKFASCSENNHLSLYNTIMLPFITTEETFDLDQNNNNKININILNENNNNNFIKKDIFSIKTESSKEAKDEKNGIDEKLTNTFYEIKQIEESVIKKDNINDKDNQHLEENPFFLGRSMGVLTYNNKNKKNSVKEIDIKNLKKNHYKDINHNSNNRNSNSIFNNSNSNLNNSINDWKDFYDSGPSKSVIFDDKPRKKSIKDDDKSENMNKKSKKLYLKRNFLNTKSDNRNNKFIKKKSFFVQSKYSKKELEKEEKKEEKEKTKADIQIIPSCRKSFYYSNKLISNYYEQNLIKNNSKINEFENSEKNLEFNEVKRSTKKLRSHRISKIKREKNSKDDKKINLKNSTRFKNNHISKGIKSLKEFINIKEKENEKFDEEASSKEKSVHLKRNKKCELKHQKYSSKKELKKIKINKKEFEKEKVKESDKEKIKVHKSLDANHIKCIKESMKNEKNYEEKEEFQNKLKSSKQIDQRDIECNKNRISKCLTSDNSRKKYYSSKLKNNYQNNTSKKKMVDLVTMKLFSSDKKISTKKKKTIDFEFALKNNLKKMQFNLFSKDKFTNTEFSDSDYLKYTLECMELILDMDIEKQTRLKNQINFNFPKTKKTKIKKKIALFDLDETIVHCTGDINTQKDKYQHVVEIKLPGKQAVKVGINIRPFWKQTFNLIKKKYHIVVYTASHQAYADSVLDFMDPKKKYFKYRLYRNNCSLVDVDGAKFYVKDLDIFKENYDLKDIVIVDNSVLSFSFHLHNGVPIVPYYDEDKDGSLYVVGLYLIHIFKEDDLREANKKQINLDSFMEEAKKRREEEYVDANQIDEESDSKEDDENNNDNGSKSDNKINNQKKDNSNDNGNSAQKLKQKNFDELKNTEKKRISDKKLNFVRKRSSNLLCSLDPHSEQNNDLAKKQLMIQSRLINTYYEVQDKSLKNGTIMESTQDYSSKKNSFSKEGKGKNEERKNETNINNEEELECKSDPGIIHNEQASDESSSNDEKEMAILKRVYTIIEEGHEESDEKNRGDKTTKNSSKSKLGFIRSNFYNNFKI